MSKYTAVKARTEFAELTNRAAYGKERIIVTRKGKEIVAIVPIEDVQLLEALENQTDIEDARKALKEKGTISWKVIKKERKR